MDLATEWRSRRWRKLLNLIDGLPGDSALAEAQADDDDLAEQLVDQDRPASSFRVSEFGTTNALLAGIFDRLGEVIAATVSAGGGKPPKVDPLPRPVTALDRAAQRLADASYDYLMEQIEAARQKGA